MDHRALQAAGGDDAQRRRQGGVKVKLIGKVKPSEKDSGASTVTFDVHLGGPALFGPIGMVVAGALKGDIRESLNKFKSVFAPAV